MSQTSGGWIGVDFDGTLVMHPDPTIPWPFVGRPIQKMVDRVKEWLAAGQEVRIVTARVSDPASRRRHLPLIETWCMTTFGQVLEVTCSKDFSMRELWDDRAVQLWPNTGERVDGNV